MAWTTPVSQVTGYTVTATDYDDQIVNNLLYLYAAKQAALSLLVNGGKLIWQRGDTFSADADYTCDRHILHLGGLGACTTTHSTNTTDLDTITSRIMVAAKHNVTTANGTTDTVFHVQEVPITTVEIPMRPTVVSYRVKVKTATGALGLGGVEAVCARVTDGTTTMLSTAHTGDDTWQSLEVANFPVDSSASTISCGLWFLAPATGSASAYVYEAGATLVPTSVGTDYQAILAADEVTHCQRYYEKLGGRLNAIKYAGFAGAGSGFSVPLRYNTWKRNNPTTISVNGTWDVVNCSQPTVWTSGGGVYATDCGGLTIGATATNQDATAFSTNTADDYIEVSAEY